MDALADQIGLRLDVDRALPLGRPVLGVDLPGALGLGAGGRLISEEDAAVGRSLLQYLRRRLGGGESW